MTSRRQNSLTQRVLDFYTARPDEWLTHADGALQFGCTEDQFRGAVERLQKDGRARLRMVSVVYLDSNGLLTGRQQP